MPPDSPKYPRRRRPRPKSDRAAALAAARDRLGALKVGTAIGSGVAVVGLAGMIAVGTYAGAHGATQNNSAAQPGGQGTGSGDTTPQAPQQQTPRPQARRHQAQQPPPPPQAQQQPQQQPPPQPPPAIVTAQS